jgi:hypothetical protein
MVYGGDWRACRLMAYGFLIEAVIGVGAVLAANIVLRPLVQAINRQSTTDTELLSSYELRAVCRPDVEERTRTAMIAAVRHAAMSLIAVYREDIEATNRVEVIADVTVAGRPDAKLEKIVTKLGIEPGVIAVSWKIVPTTGRGTRAHIESMIIDDTPQFVHRNTRVDNKCLNAHDSSDTEVLETGSSPSPRADANCKRGVRKSSDKLAASASHTAGAGAPDNGGAFRIDFTDDPAGGRIPRSDHKSLRHVPWRGTLAAAGP